MTRDDVRAFSVPRRHVLEQQVEMFLGLIDRRDGSEAAAVAHLRHGLMSEILNWIPDSVTRLVIVPDGVLHRVPFETLRETRDDLPLVERFEIVRTPSAALWIRWNLDAGDAAAGVALSLVDPRSPTSDPLPHAMAEAQALLRRARPGVVKAGAEATEAYLKATDLGPYGVLHFGTHAIVDEPRPERSGVVLAPGSSDEDGLLQTREIVDLELEGRVVILSSCRSARGELLEGEGVLGLARTFFEGGAHVVIGSLWPVRDGETAALVQEFARQLSRGRTIAAAMNEARRRRMNAGAPAQAWAGLVVLGNGDHRPAFDARVLPWWWP